MDIDPDPAIDRTLVMALQAHLQARCGAPIELVETHISWVLLGPRLAWKLKKPVRLPFLDFSTARARQAACREELRLNRRLAPTLYRAVVPVRGTPSAPCVGGAGASIDHLVLMRRFAPGALLSEQLLAGTLEAAHLEQLANRMAAFHAAAPVAQAGDPAGSPARVLKAVLDVLQQLESRPCAPSVATLRAWIGSQASALATAWEARRRQGAVRECHGDLHLANCVRLGGEVTAFDCIEFDPALRWIDVMSDVAFLTMDLQAHGRPDLAFRFLDAYLQAGGDHGGLGVWRFYSVYRALVRALVHLLQPPGSAPRRDYLACALALARGSAPRLIVTCGVSGSGKSTVATQLLEALGAIRLRSDVERKRLFGLGAMQRSADLALDIYTEQATRQTFDRLLALAAQALLAGFPVVVDAAFLRRKERALFRALAGRQGVPFTIVHCHADHEVLVRRLHHRAVQGSDPSEATVDVLERQLATQEPPDETERACTMSLSTEGQIDIEALLAHLPAA